MRTPTSIVHIDTLDTSIVRRWAAKNWQLLFVDYAAAHSCDAFNTVQRMFSRTWSCAVMTDRTVHWVCTDTGVMASSAAALAGVGWRWTALAIQPSHAAIRNYVHACRTVNAHGANRWWMLGALIDCDDCENCTTVAGRLLDVHTAWPDRLRNIAASINT